MAVDRKKILAELQKPFDRDLFSRKVLIPLFKSGFSLNANPKAISVPGKAASSIIDSALIYGNIHLEDGASILCYEVRLMPGKQIEHNKVFIQHYIDRLLATGDAALISFVSGENTGTWRLTLITRSNEVTVKGLSDKTVKQFTWLLGPCESCKIPASRLETLCQETTIDLQALIRAFSVGKLARSFFDEYRRHYLKFCDYLQGSDYWSEIFRIVSPAHSTKPGTDRSFKPIRDFTKKLLGRMVFLYFIQKKGWLGASSVEYKDGPPDFMMRLFTSSGGNESFYNDWLSPLFFDILNKKRAHDDFIMPGGQTVKVPFLHGGLFEKEEYDEYSLKFPPTFFHNTDYPEDPAHRGFFDFLNAFNFTMHENSPDDQTLAVDPEMLGHIFENLLEDNKNKGTYYTPKEIVHYMCRQSLVEFLLSHLSKEYPVNRADVEKLVTQKRASVYSREQLLRVDELLDTIKICDPAIGSGAFPVGLLQEIHAIRELVSYETGTEWKPSDVKEKIIRNSMYGVDIEKGAVAIARLRFWLSLIVDEDNPAELPNLNHQIVTGDSVLNFDWNLHFPEVFNPHITDGNRGFDIIIANPPYIGQKGNKELFGPLNSDPGFEKKMDYWYFFLHRSYAITKSAGINIFITPNYWVTARGGKKIRKRIMEDYRIASYINFNENNIFEAGVHTNIFILQKGGPPNPEINCTIYQNKYAGNIFSYREQELNFYADQRTLYNSWTGFIHFLPAESSDIINQLYRGCEKLSDNESKGEKKANTVAGKKITNGICNINQGIITGRDRIRDRSNNINTGVYVLTKEELQELGLSTNERKYIKPFIKNSHIGNYYVQDDTGYWILYVDAVQSEEAFNELPAIARHFSRFRDALSKRFINGVLQSAYKKGKWWALIHAVPVEIIRDPVIICPQRSRWNLFGYHEGETYASADVYYISLNKIGYSLKYILAVLNSRVIYYWLYWMGKRKGDMLELYFEPLQFIPIKKISTEDQRPFIVITEYIIYLKNHTDLPLTGFFEKLINGMVYELYFPEIFQENNCMVVDHLGELSPLTENMNGEERQRLISSVFDRLNDKEHPVFNNLMMMNSLYPVSTIEAKYPG